MLRGDFARLLKPIFIKTDPRSGRIVEVRSWILTDLTKIWAKNRRRALIKRDSHVASPDWEKAYVQEPDPTDMPFVGPSVADQLPRFAPANAPFVPTATTTPRAALVGLPNPCSESHETANSL
jgi:hypothetical protein